MQRPCETSPAPGCCSAWAIEHVKVVASSTQHLSCNSPFLKPCISSIRLPMSPIITSQLCRCRPMKQIHRCW